jgi:hypothetical protein
VTGRPTARRASRVPPRLRSPVAEAQRERLRRRGLSGSSGAKCEAGLSGRWWVCADPASLASGMQCPSRGSPSS